MSKRLREMRLSPARARAERHHQRPGFRDSLSRARARVEQPAADPAEKFVKQAHDLGAVRKAVEDAASVSAGLWLSYIFVLPYIGIAASLQLTEIRRFGAQNAQNFIRTHSDGRLSGGSNPPQRACEFPDRSYAT